MQEAPQMAFEIRPRMHALKHLAERASKFVDRGAAYQTFYAEQVRFAAAVEALARLQESRDPTITEAAHLRQVATSAKQLEKMINPSLERMSKAVYAHLKDIERRVNQKVHLIPDQYAPEVRAVFRSLGKTDQLKML